MTFERIYRAIHFTDIHLSPLNRIPASRTETYHADCAAELRSLWAEGERLKVDSYFFSGDVFNLKRSELYAPEHILHYVRLFEEAARPIYGIPGNHDLPKSSYGELHRSAYKLFTDASTNFIDVSFKPKHITLGVIPLTIMGIPFLPNEETATAISQAASQMAINDYSGNTLKVLLVHTDIAPASMPMHWDFFSYDDLMAMAPQINVFCGGHIHQRYPLYFNEQTGQVISKPFSMGRVYKDYFVSTEDENLRHLPEYALIDVLHDPETGAFKVDLSYHPVPDAVPFEAAFNFDTLKQELENSARTSTFIEDLQRQFGSAHDAFSIPDPEKFLAQQSLPAEVAAVIHDYLERA